MSHVDTTLERLHEKFGDLLVDELHGHVAVTIPSDKLLEGVAFLLSDVEMGYTQVVDVTGIDWYGREPRFEVTYQLLSHLNHSRISLRTFASSDNPTVPSITRIFRGGNWFERETWDMFGVKFDGHP